MSNGRRIVKNIECNPTMCFTAFTQLRLVQKHDLTKRQQDKRKTICEALLERHKRRSLLKRIVTGDESWVYYDNLKRRKAWVEPGLPGSSTPKRNIHESKVMLCIWWDEKIEMIKYNMLTSFACVHKKKRLYIFKSKYVSFYCIE